MKGDMYVSADGILGFPDDIEHKLFFRLEVSSVHVTRSDLSSLPAMIDRVVGLCGRGLYAEMQRYIDKRLKEEEE